jgi:hypothetical protein
VTRWKISSQPFLLAQVSISASAREIAYPHLLHSDTEFTYKGKDATGKDGNDHAYIPSSVWPQLRQWVDKHVYSISQWEVVQHKASRSIEMDYRLLSALIQYYSFLSCVPEFKRSTNVSHLNKTARFEKVYICIHECLAALSIHTSRQRPPVVEEKTSENPLEGKQISANAPRVPTLTTHHGVHACKNAAG